MWSNLLPELLGVIIKMVEESEESWPRRRNLVACAGVCKRWREVVIGTVESVGGSGKITFPLSLKQPGPKELPVQCFIKRNRKISTFYLYLDFKEDLVSLALSSKYMTLDHPSVVQRYPAVEQAVVLEASRSVLRSHLEISQPGM